MKRYSLTGIVAAVAVVILFATGCNRGVNKEIQADKKPVPLVKVYPAESGEISRVIETTGEVFAPNTVTISSTVDGTIVFCPWREGDRINRAGTKLIGIDRALYREEVDMAVSAMGTAEARLKDLKAGARPEEIAQAEEAVKDLEESAAFAKIDMDRTARLVTSGGLPAEALEKARVAYTSLNSKLAAARERLNMLKAGPTSTAVAVQKSQVREASARVGQAKAKLAENIITAPFAGIVLKAFVSPGDMASPKSPLLEIADMSSLAIRFTVPESSASSVHEGMRVVVVLDAYPGKEYEAKIARVYPELDRRMRTRTVEARMVDNVEIVPGMFARLKVLTETARNAVVVPVEAVLVTPKGERVAYVIRDGKAEQRKVETGIEQDGRVQIATGIKPGEKVVVAGNEKLKDGVPVKVAGKESQPQGGMKGGGKNK